MENKYKNNVEDISFELSKLETMIDDFEYESHREFCDAGKLELTMFMGSYGDSCSKAVLRDPLTVSRVMEYAYKLISEELSKLQSGDI